MILQSLNQFYDRLESDSDDSHTPFGFSRQKISFCVVLDHGASPIVIEDIREVNGDRHVPRSLVVPGHAKPSGPGIHPGFLWDNQSYLLGYDPNTKDSNRARESFDAFRHRHLTAECDINDAAFSMVCRFLESWNAAEVQKFAMLANLPAGFGVFRIAGENQYVHEKETIQCWWKRQIIADHPGESQTMGQCLVTGQVGPIARLHTPKIKGIWGAQSSGAAIVAFNRTAFESYGKHQCDSPGLSDSGGASVYAAVAGA